MEGDADPLTELAQGISDEGESEQFRAQDDVERRPTVESPDMFWSRLREICQEVGGEWDGVDEKIWAFGSQSAGGCMMVDARKGGPFTA